MLAAVTALLFLAALLVPAGPHPAADPAQARIAAQDTAPKAALGRAVARVAPDPASAPGPAPDPADVPAVPDAAARSFHAVPVALAAAADSDARSRPTRPASQGPPPSA